MPTGRRSGRRGQTEPEPQDYQSALAAVEKAGAELNRLQKQLEEARKESERIRTEGGLSSGDPRYQAALRPATEALHAIRAHNGERTGTARDTELDFALRCAETVTGLVAANAMVRPTKMAGMKPKSLKKKMKEKAFAANVDREIIRECDKIGLELGDFFQIAIDEVTRIAAEVDLA